MYKPTKMDRFWDYVIVGEGVVFCVLAIAKMVLDFKVYQAACRFYDIADRL